MKIRAWLCTVFLSSSLFALPVGNPSSPQLVTEGAFLSCGTWFHLRMGYEGNWIFHEKMKFQEEEIGFIDEFKGDSNVGSATFNVAHRLDVYGLVGGSRIHSDWNLQVVPYELFDRIEFETKYHPIWEVGMRGILFEWGDTAFCMSGRYARSHMPLQWLTQNGRPIEEDPGQLSYKEWQLDLGFSHKFCLLIPYFCVKYSRVKADLSLRDPFLLEGVESVSMRNKNHYGIVIGCSITEGKFFFLNIESRLIGENALSLSGELRF